VYRHSIKRISDVVFSLAAMIALSWLLVLIVIGYFCSGRFNLIFIQKRIGYQNKFFMLYKFKTLSDVAEKKDLQSRRFWWGDVLRFFSLDELPQLLNVVKGDMSLIGPRPLPVDYLPLMNASQRRRHEVRPGISGWTQVNGRHRLTWTKKFELDCYYVDHVSLFLDLKIFLKTIGLLLLPGKDVSLMEEKFKGN
jgi:undecaprenyl phosphate N,N'-diacetylbacillosamine 1-phosphate transferase